MLTGFGNAGGVTVGVVLFDPVGMVSFNGSDVVGVNFEEVPPLDVLGIFARLLLGFGATGGGILLGGGIARASSLNGSG